MASLLLGGGGAAVVRRRALLALQLSANPTAWAERGGVLLCVAVATLFGVVLGVARPRHVDLT
jgi:hypothetical protein